MSSDQLRSGSEQLLEHLRKEVIDKKKDDIIREIISHRMSEMSGNPVQNIPPCPSNSAHNLLSSRMEHLLNLPGNTAGANYANELLQKFKN